jgi:hypothetical protein
VGTKGMDTMRIIHEMTVPAQCSCGTSPYCNTPGFCGYNGVRVELLMVNSPSANFKDDAKLVEPLDKEIIEIEGPLEVVLDAFKQVVEMLEKTKKFLQEEMGPKRVLDCPNCSLPSIYDKQDANACHTWECQAKWVDVAKKQIQDDPELVEQQNGMIQKGIERLQNAHFDCGGSGCRECEWTGKKMLTTI